MLPGGAPATWNRSATASLFRNSNAAGGTAVTTPPTVSTNNTSTIVTSIATTTTGTTSSSTSPPLLPSTAASSPLPGPVASSTTDPSLLISALARHPDYELCYNSSDSVPFVSSAALESKEDDSAVTEELLVDLAKQESEQEASDLKEVLQLSLLASQSSSLPTETTVAAGSEISCSSISNSGAGVSVVPVVPVGIDNMQLLFPTGDDLLLQHALQVFLQDSASTQNYNNSTTNDSQPSASAAAESSGQMNVDLPYVNFAARSDCWDDCDEELMRAIERSLQE